MHPQASLISCMLLVSNNTNSRSPPKGTYVKMGWFLKPHIHTILYILLLILSYILFTFDILFRVANIATILAPPMRGSYDFL